jgi:poly(3-hydroxybutyrate) depolymerase
LYDAYQAQADLMAPARNFAGLAHSLFDDTSFGPGGNMWLRGFAGMAELFSRAGLTHDRPSYEIDFVTVKGRDIPVTEEIALETPFGRLLRFRKDQPTEQPRILIVAPMAGHFATLLRHTARVMLADHDVYITDWINARDIPAKAGRFGTDEYVEHLIRFLEEIGPGVHAMAVCQPCAALLTATAVMSKRQSPAIPRSVTLMAGPVDASVNPTEVNRFATSHSLSWFQKNLIARVPQRHAGAGRQVYPGFIQVAAFLSMNPSRHIRAQWDLFGYILRGHDREANANRRFYDDYLAVADMPAEFYLETLRNVFQQYRLARGTLDYQGEKVDPAAISQTALLTVEGEKDDICSVGQTSAALDLCPNAPVRENYVQPGAGHYGVFSGRRWQNEIYPIVREMIAARENAASDRSRSAPSPA